MTPLQRLARVAHPVASPQKWLAMFIAYFDGSGKLEDSKVLSMAGLVAPAKDWETFELKWQRILRRNRVSVMHMTDFNAREGEFKGWDDHKRTTFISELAAVTEKAIRFGVFHSLVVKEWHEVMTPSIPTPYKKKRLPYIILIQTCLEDIARFVKPPRGETIALVFEEDSFLQFAIGSWITGVIKYRALDSIFGSITFDKKVLPPLQAADMLAFEGSRATQNKVLATEVRPIRKLLKALTVSGKITGGRFDKEGLQTMCEAIYGTHASEDD